MSEESCIITSLNLYEFSQVNNNEMGVLIRRDSDDAMYKDAYEEAQRIIRISDEVRISLETIAPQEPGIILNTDDKKTVSEKLTTSKLAKKLKLSSKELRSKLVSSGYLEPDGDDHKLTHKGTGIGAEAKRGRFGEYILWPDHLSV